MTSGKYITYLALGNLFHVARLCEFSVPKMWKLMLTSNVKHCPTKNINNITIKDVMNCASVPFTDCFIMCKSY